MSTYRTPLQALVWAKTHPTYSGKGMCQRESRLAYAVPSDGTPSAAKDWFGADFRHPMTAVYTAKNFESVPLGALLRWTGGSSGAGHVALYSGIVNGEPYMISTDLKDGRYVPGVRSSVPVSLASRLWGLRFVGWTEDIDGVHVVAPVAVAKPLPKPEPKPTRHSGAGTIHAAPSHRFFHDDHRISTGGGVVSDSIGAAALAASKHYHWIDSDLHVTHRTTAGKKSGHRDLDMVAVNGHGSPFYPAWLCNSRFEEHSLQDHHMLLFADTLRRNAQHGLSTEIEVKDLHGYATEAHLARLFAQLAADAQRAYGAKWRDHAIVKVLSNLGGGLDYALRVLKAAHAAGFRGMLLARGKWVVTRIPAEAAAYVSWVRGARKGLYPAVR
jgi:hypothetical protein